MTKVMIENGKKLPEVNLRAIEPEDLDLLYDVENDRELWDAGCTNVPYSRYKLLEYITSSRQDIFADQQLRLMIDNAEGKTVGIIDLTNYEPRYRRAELGIVVLSAERRRGYATAALKKIIDYAREIPHLHQLYALVNDGNDASLSLLADSGFHVTGTLHDWFFQYGHYSDAKIMQMILE